MKTKLLVWILCAAALLCACMGKKANDTENQKSAENVAGELKRILLLYFVNG